MDDYRKHALAWLLLAGLTLFARPALAQHGWPFILPEQRTIQIRDPADLPPARIPDIPRPPTVSAPRFDAPPRNLSLNEAINTALANSEVVRVLAGVTAVSSGRTVYDVAITNTRIDQAQAAFDPSLQIFNTWSRSEPPIAAFDPFDPQGVIIGGSSTDRYDFNLGLTKQTLIGGTLDFGVNTDNSRFGVPSGVLPLNPQDRSAVDLSYTQPLLQGGGLAVNQVPIVLARIETERSFFQYKSSVQEEVRGIIEAYWALVSARTSLWAAEQQVTQAEFANSANEAKLRAGIGNIGEVAQTRVALGNFRSSLLSAQSNVLSREAALRNILGFPPYDPNRIVPVTPPLEQELLIEWEGLLELAQQQRPDIIELKLILEADQQLLLQARNQALPRLDAGALYRWNGLSGEVPLGGTASSAPGQFTDWTLSVNFSVPLGLRRERALLRQQELLIARDRANLDQGIHQTAHNLAMNLRNLDLAYRQYRQFQAVREAASLNLDLQQARYGNGIVPFIIALQAIVDWGNAVSSEAQALALYNTELANLENETGTILETHGIAFYEERFGSIGPLGRIAADRCYPRAMPPTPAIDRYPTGERPSEDAFDLRDPVEERRRRNAQPEQLPPPPNNQGLLLRPLR